jgi:hypothetical protein
MDDSVAETDLQQALATVQQYLSDAIAPLMAVEAVSLLLEHPAQLIAVEINKWTSGQIGATEAGAGVSDYYFHALRKLHEMGRLKLIPEVSLAAQLKEVGNQLLSTCPAEDREQFAASMVHLAQSDSALTPAVTLLHRPAGSRGSESEPGEERNRKTGRTGGASRRLSILWDRLEAGSAQPSQPLAKTSRGELIAQVVTEAASCAQSGEELQSIQEDLSTLGIGTGTEQMFRTLGGSLPGWAIPVRSEDGTEAVPPAKNATVEAMRRLIRLAENPWEADQRFRNLVHAAIDQFNTGSLARASTMFDLAGSLAAELSLKSSAVIDIRETTDTLLDPNRLRSFSETREKHSLLRKVLSFFNKLQPVGLLDCLQWEPKRDRRRLILNLLEVHGDIARRLVLERLRNVSLSTVREDWYFQRNLIVLLGRIPRPAGTPPDEETELMIAYCDPRLPVPLVREAITNLGQIKHARGEQHLIESSLKLEGLVAAAQRAGDDASRLESLLDRSILVLARYGTPGTCRRVVDHALDPDADAGAMARISYLSGQDISIDNGSLHRMLDALRHKIPRKIFGALIQKDEPALLSLIRALTSTPKAEVRRMLQGIAERFPDEEFGRAAAKALEEQPARSPDSKTPTEKLAGDLELFGLPDLLQQFARLGLSGTLTVKNDSDRPVGTIALVEGRLKGCSAGALKGETGLYQLLEKPVAKTFVFLGRRSRTGHEPEVSSLPELMPIVYEGMRRHDELQRARAVVPDTAALKATGAEPVPTPGEDEPALISQMWRMIASGASPEECEANCPADSYKIRDLLVRWVEEGILTLA